MNPRVWLLVGAAFVLGTNMLLMSGLLPMIASELETSEAVIGMSQSAFSVTYAIAAPVLPIVLARCQRRTIMMGALGLFVVSTAGAAIADDIGLFIAARVVSALASAAFPSQAVAVAMEIVDARLRARAMALVVAGMMLSMAGGVPIGTLIAEAAGYRMTFVIILAAAAIAFVGLFALPHTSKPPRAALRDQVRPLVNPRLLVLVAIAMLFMTGEFIITIYVAPLLAHTAGLDPSLVAVVLIACGVAGALGMVYGSRFVDRFGGYVVGALVLAALTVVTPMISLSHTLLLAVLILVPWSVLLNVAAPAVQYESTGLHPQNPAAAFGLVSAGLNMGGALAGVIGAGILTTVGPGWLPAAATVPTFLAFLLMAGLIRVLRRKHRDPVRQ